MSRGVAVLTDLAADPHGNHPEYKGHDPEKSSYEEPAQVKYEAVGAKGRTGFMAPAWKVMDVLERQLGVEARGIERVPPNERHHVAIRDNFTLWMSANCTVSTFALGTLGASVWRMDFKTAALTILFFNLITTLVPSYFATFGKALGVRALAFSRFTFGYYAVLIPTILNLIACIGWSVINTIAGGLVLRAATHTHRLPLTAAIIIIAVATLIVSFFGYKIVHAYERYVWIPVAVIFFIVLGQSARYYEAGSFTQSGVDAASGVLSFGAAIVGFVFGWSSLAGDYTVNMPVEASTSKLFLWTYLGMNIPMILLELLGAACMTTFNQKTTWADAYDNESIGGLLGATLQGPMGGFGSFLMIILGLSIIANNIPNIYSFAMTFQVLGPWAQTIPRPILSLFATIVYTALACAGQHSFETVLDNLLLFLGYWLSMYCTMILIEHFVFRGGKWSNYDVDRYDQASSLPVGIAAFFGIAAGWAGAVIGMSTSFYVGPVAIKIGSPPFGTDIGFPLAIGFTGIVFLPLRYLEKKKFGR